ncbi:MAG TPA: hypothetical protein ENN79_03470 [Desulfobacteraceae bacterium]|nr:hypothetical protein [Desulfobacteraceae bacterium]
MNWKFWTKKAESDAGVQQKALPKPKAIPEVVGRHLVVEMKKDPDFVWKLMAVVRPRPDNKNAFDVRVYSPVEAGVRSVNVKNYNTLDAAPDLILYEGWYDKAANTTELIDRSQLKDEAAVAV